MPFILQYKKRSWNAYESKEWYFDPLNDVFSQKRITYKMIPLQISQPIIKVLFYLK